MLFLESKTLNHAVDGDARTRLLQELQDMELTPLIRSTRLRCFADVVLDADRVSEVESSLASWNETTIGEPYVRGDLFCFHDYDAVAGGPPVLDEVGPFSLVAALLRELGEDA